MPETYLLYFNHLLFLGVQLCSQKVHELTKSVKQGTKKPRYKSGA